MALYPVPGIEPAAFVGLSTDTKPVQSVAPGAKFFESDTGLTYIWKGDPNQGTTSDWVSFPDPVSMQSHLGGEEDIDDAFASRLRVTKDKKVYRYAFGDGDVTVFAGPCRLLGIYVNVAFADGGITLHARS